MKTKVEISSQVASFVRKQAPQPRKQLRLALRALEQGKGDIKALEGELEGFLRVRAGRFRIIFYYHVTPKSRLARCVYAERRSLVYETFSETLIERLRGD